MGQSLPLLLQTLLSPCTPWGEVWVPSCASRPTPFTALRLQATMNVDELSALAPQDKTPIQ